MIASYWGEIQCIMFEILLFMSTRRTHHFPSSHPRALITSHSHLTALAQKTAGAAEAGVQVILV